MAKGGVWVPVNAQMKGFVATVMKAVSGAARKSGQEFEKEFSKSGESAGKALARKVEQATNALSRARRDEAQSAKELAVAEQELENIRSKGNASASQIIAAENKVATAKAKNEDASMRVARSEKDLEAARSGQSTTSNAVKRAEDQLSQARIKATDAVGKVKAAEAGVDEARSNAKSAADAVKAAEQNLIDVRDRYGAGTKQTAAAERELEKAKRQASSANTAAARAEGDLGKARANLQNATDSLKSKENLHKQAVQDAAQATNKAGAEARKAAGDVTKFGGAMGGATGKAGGFGRSMLDIAKKAGGMAGAFAGISGVTSVLSGGFERLMNVQRAEIMFQSVGLSADQTKAQMEQLTEQVTGTSVSLADAAKYSAMFAQSGVQLGKPMNDAIDAFTSLSSIAEGSGVDVGRVLQQMSAAGKVTGEDLNQMADAGVNATKYLADHMGMSQEEIKKAVSDGKVSFEDFVGAVNKGTGDLAKEMGQTLPAKLANMKTSFSNFGAAVIEPFIGPLTTAVEFVTTGMKNVTSAIKDATGEGGALRPVMDAVGDAFKTVGRFVQDNATWLGPLALGLGAAATQFVALYKAMKFVEMVKTAKAAGELATKIKIVGAATKVWTGIQAGFNFVMGLNPIVLIGAAIVAAGVALWAFFTKTEKGREIWGKFTDFMKTAWDATTRFFKDAYSAYIEPVFDWIGDKWENLKSLFSAGFGENSNLGGMFTTLKDAVGVAVDWIGQKWAELGPAMSQIYDTWIRPVVDFFKAGIDMLSTAIQWWVNNITKPALDLLGQAFQIVWNTFIKPVIDGFKTGVDLLGQILQIIINGVIVPAWQFMGDMFMSVWTNVVNPVWEFMKNLVGVLADVLTGNFDNIKNRFSDMGRNIHDIVMGVVKSAMDFFRGLVEMVGNAWQAFKDIVQTVVDTVKQKIQEMVDRLSQFPGQVQNLFSQAGQWLVSAGRNIINGLWEGMKSAWSSVKNWLSNNLSFSAIGSLVGLRSGGIVVNAEGGIMRAYIDGGIDQLEQYANGGRRGERHVAQIAPAGSWRVWAEPETGGEAYIPLARSKRGRSTAILDEVAGRFGYQLVDERTGRPYDGNYSGNLGPQHVTQFAEGGVVTGDDLLSFVGGADVGYGAPRRPLHDAPYDWGGVNWGDCSGTVSAVTNTAVGKQAFGSRFATANEASMLTSMGFSRGHGEPGDLRVGMRNGGPAGGHTSGTLPDGTNFEMGGAANAGSVGARAAGADDSYYNEFFYLPMAPAFEDVQLDDLGDLSPDEQMAAYAQNPDAVTAHYAEQAEPYVADTMPDTTTASEPQAFGGETTISGAAGSVVQELVTGQVGDALAVFGVPDTIPSWLIGAQKLASKFWNGPDKKYGQGDNPGTSAAEQHAIENHDAAVTSMTPTEIAADPQLRGMDDMDVIVQPEVPEWGPEFFAYEIARHAKDMNLGADGAKIGVATAMVESGDPMKMYANDRVPESKQYRHDAVGSDHDSVGLFQQRDNGAWGTVAQRMDPYESAGMFFRELVKFDWRSMDPGAAAQKVQRSAFPDRYATKMGSAEQAVAGTGLFNGAQPETAAVDEVEAGVYDNGGVLKHGAAAFNFSKKPEAILTNEQWTQLQGVADSAMNSDLAKELTTAINGGTGEDGQKHGGILKEIQGVTMGNIRQQLPNLARQIVSGTVRTGGTLALSGAKAGLGMAGAGVDAGIGAVAGAAGSAVPGIGAVAGFSSLGDAATSLGGGAIDAFGQPVVDMAAWYTGEVAAGWTDAFLQYGEQLFGTVEAPFQDILGPVSSAVNQVSSKVNEMPVGGGTVGASESQGEQQSGSLRGPTTVINVHSVAEAMEMQRHAERRELAGFGLGR
ncbi:tape measure protein [Corynebacterium amycolatum]|uniref:Tape measure protein n=1 Tax=Corynebacterium amycolatum TaxID=43765 RepID=A0A7T4KQU0_CORAY|nr:tape measure protein [Corynebacterium amycolatum]QQB83786.1 tape measure protein [Corynebacterium amycolatum]